MRVLVFLITFFLFGLSCLAQVVNAYAKVTNIAGTTFTLSNVNQVNHTFVVGEFVVVMQMQDDVIGTTANNASFGNLSSIESAGLYEIREITAINGNTTLGYSSAALTSLTVIALANSYNTGANQSLQIISFRQYGAGDYTTTADMEALDWDGNIGGVLAVYVPGVLTLNHSISADADGFRGGLVSDNYSGPICNPSNSTRYRANNARLGYKGEGIYKSTDALHNNGRGKLLNGGGGGSHHNGGGGGGGNYTAGGIGGNGWNNCTANPAGGFGGISLSGEITGNRIFMGGGGGGGQQNNSRSRNGGDGGGIILLKASEIRTDACGGVSISANGIGPATSGTNDGGGGGGAAGSIVFWVDTWSIAAPCPLTISANGGNGSSSLSGGSHAGGGGGAQGVIIFNGAQPTGNVTTETSNGTPGCGNTSVPCNSLAGSPTGADDAGIFTGTGTPLPIELINFYGERINNSSAYIRWTTKSEINNDYFTLYRSTDAYSWKKIDKIKGAGNSSEEIAYAYTDWTIDRGINYYKLEQTDYDGTSTFSEIIAIENEVDDNRILIYPNPVQNHVEILASTHIESLEVINGMGNVVFYQDQINQKSFSVDLSFLAPTVYILRLKTSKEVSHHQFVKK